MKVGWVGLGRVGLPCALVLAKHVGVIGYDISGVPYRAINDRRTPDLTEPGLADLIEYNERLRTADSIDEVVAASDLVFVAVQTPHAPEYDGSQPMPGDRRDFDYTALRTVVAQLAQAAYAQERHITVVVESTVLPGTSDRVLRPLLNEYTTLVYNPFLIAMGTVIEDFTRPEMVIIGADQPGHVQPLVALYNFVHDAPIHYCSIASAELLKCAYNTFISAKIVFANALMEICHSTAADVDEVTRGLALATDRVVSAKYLSGGMGDGGACHPRDLIAMSWLSEQLDLSYDLFGELVRAREHQTRWLARQVVDQARLRGRGTIVVLGDAYKADVPLRVGSPAVLLAGMIRDIDNTLVVYAVDPVTRTGRVTGHGDAVYVHATPHAAFVDYKFPHGSVVVDPWRKSWPIQHDVTFIPIGAR